MLSESDNSVRVKRFQYDGLNRLVDELGYDKIKRSYVYDAAGNRTMVLATKGSEQQQTKYEYNEQNRLMRTEVLGGIENGKSLNNVESTYFSYDANGNLLYMNKEALTPIASQPDTVDLPTFSMFVVGETKPSENPMVSWSQSYSYNAWNQMVASKANGATSLYDYNAEGLRTSVVENGVMRNMLYVYDDVVLEYDEKGNTLAVNTYGHNLISRTVGEKSLNYLYNANGDVTGLVGSAAGYDYDAFGRGISAGPAEDNPYRYGGYRFDAGSGLYYLGSRMYNPDLGRFMQEDSYRGDMKDPLSLNLYTYCSNNPLIYVDPDGYMGVPGQQTVSNDGGSSTPLKKAFVAPTPAPKNPHKDTEKKQATKQVINLVAPVVKKIIEKVTTPTNKPTVSVKASIVEKTNIRPSIDQNRVTNKTLTPSGKLQNVTSGANEGLKDPVFRDSKRGKDFESKADALGLTGLEKDKYIDFQREIDSPFSEGRSFGMAQQSGLGEMLEANWMTGEFSKTYGYSTQEKFVYDQGVITGNAEVSTISAIFDFQGITEGQMAFDDKISKAADMAAAAEYAAAFKLKSGIKGGSQTALVLYDAKFAAKQMLTEGKINLSELESMIPNGAVNTFKPSDAIAEGYKYNYTINGTKIEIKWHSPDANAAAKFPGSNSGNGWTAQIKVGNKLLGLDGNLYKNPSNLTHIPVMGVGK